MLVAKSVHTIKMELAFVGPRGMFTAELRLKEILLFRTDLPSRKQDAFAAHFLICRIG